MFKKIVLNTAVVAALLASSSAQAAWYDDVADWFVGAAEDTVEWTENAAVDVAGWFVDTIISPLGVVFDTVEAVVAYEELVTDALGSHGYTSSGGLNYTAPTQWAGASGTLNVATFNVHGFPEVLNGETDADVAKMSTLVERWGFDIIGFQEDWVVNPALVSNLTNDSYGYRTNHFAGVPGTLGDGLMTASKYPMDKNKAQRIQFSKCNGTLLEFLGGKVDSPDCITEKGFTIAEVAIAKDFVVHFYNMHGNTGNNDEVTQSDLNDMKAYINGYSAGHPVVVTGDFNMAFHRGDYTDQPAQLANWLADTGLEFTCADGSPEMTAENCSGLIDFIAFRGNAQFEMYWLSSTEHVDNLDEDSSQDKLSDHRPRSAVLGWINLYQGAQDLASASWNWDVGQPDGGESNAEADCAILKAGTWHDRICEDISLYFACEDEAGNWAVSTTAGTWSQGTATCQALGNTYEFSAPTNTEANNALIAVNTEEKLWLNYTDADVEGEWVLSQGNRQLTDSGEPDSINLTAGFRLNSGENITTQTRRLKVHENGTAMVVKYNYLTKTEGGILWQSGGAEDYDASAALVFQGDGNFVLYGSGVAKWATGTQDANKGGNGGRSISLQGDGNLAIYNGSGGHLWNAGTHDAQSVEHGFTTQQKVALKTNFNTYLRAQNGGGSDQRVNANTTGAGVWTHTDLIAVNPVCPQNGDEVYLLSQDNNYWGAWTDGTLVADGSNMNDWQQFTLINHTDTSGCLAEGDVISLKSFHGKYVVADDLNAAYANRTSIGPWEKFTVEYID